MTFFNLNLRLPAWYHIETLQHC